MTFRQWRNIAFLLSAVYLTGYVIAYLNGSLWYLAHVELSALAALAILRISQSKVAYALSLIEIAALGVIALSWHQSPYNGFVYINHEVIIETLALAQAILLVVGGLLYGVANAIERVGVGHLFRRKVYNGGSRVVKPIKAEVCSKRLTI